MRIIAGKHRGKKLIISQDSKIRPTTDRTKEVMFNILQYHYPKQLAGVVVDAFSGSGSLGIECLSRGAGYVVFLDIYDVAIKLLLKNLNTLSYIKNKNYDVILGDVTTFNFKTTLSKCNLIFLDAPYNSDGVQLAINNILSQSIIDDESIFVIESNQYLALLGLKILITKKIGNTILFFCQAIKIH